MEKIHHANINQKNVGITILLLGKVDFREKNIIADKEGQHLLLIKLSTSY